MEIRKLFTLKEREDADTFISDNEEQDEQHIRITYYQSGYGAALKAMGSPLDRKSTRLNSSHVKISYAVFCLKKKKKNKVNNQKDVKTMKTNICVRKKDRKK